MPLIFHLLFFSLRPRDLIFALAYLFSDHVCFVVSPGTSCLDDAGVSLGINMCIYVYIKV